MYVQLFQSRATPLDIAFAIASSYTGKEFFGIELLTSLYERRPTINTYNPYEIVTLSL